MISNQAVADALGGLPPTKIHCSVLAEDALNAAVLDYRNKTPSPSPSSHGGEGITSNSSPCGERNKVRGKLERD